MKKLVLGVLGLLVSSDALAQKFQDWTTTRGVNSDVVAAETANDSSGYFGMLCYISSQDCYWALVIEPTCENGSSYPVMANTDAGAQSLELTCIHVGKEGVDKLMVFRDFDAISELAKKGSRVGFAVPMKGGQFRVMRFSLLGASAASERASELTVRAQSKNTRDLTL